MASGRVPTTHIIFFGVIVSLLFMRGDGALISVLVGAPFSPFFLKYFFVLIENSGLLFFTQFGECCREVMVYEGIFSQCAYKAF